MSFFYSVCASLNARERLSNMITVLRLSLLPGATLDDYALPVCFRIYWYGIKVVSVAV